MSAPVPRRLGTDAPAAWAASLRRGEAGRPQAVPRGWPGLTLAPEDRGTDRQSTGRSVTGAGWEALTPRELEVVELVTLGATNQQTARRLQVSPHTVNAHLRHVFDKLGVSSRVELTRVTLAWEQGWASAGPRSSAAAR